MTNKISLLSFQQRYIYPTKIAFGFFIILSLCPSGAFANTPSATYGNCISSEIFDIRTNDTVNGRLFIIKKNCPPPPPKAVPSILEEHTGKGDDGKIRVKPKNSMEDVRKRFHRMKRPLPGKRKD